MSRTDRKMRTAALAGGLACLVGAAATPSAHAALLDTNLVANPGFEDVDTNPDNGDIFGSLATFDWDGQAFAYDYSQGYTAAAAPGTGDKYWYGGGTGGGESSQSIDVSSGDSAAAIAGGSARYDLSAFFSTYQSQGDFGTVTASFLDGGGGELASAIVGGEAFVTSLPLDDGDGTWGQDMLSGDVPAGTVSILVTLTGSLGEGQTQTNAADGYIDNVSLIITPEPGSIALIGLGGLAMLKRRRQ